MKLLAADTTEAADMIYGAPVALSRYLTSVKPLQPASSGRLRKPWNFGDRCGSTFDLYVHNVTFNRYMYSYMGKC